MINSDTRQLEELLSAATDGDFAPEHIAQLNSLLLDRADLQDHYCRWMSLHVWLESEFSLAGTAFTALLPELPRNVLSESPHRVLNAKHYYRSLPAGVRSFITANTAWHSRLAISALLAIVGFVLFQAFSNQPPNTSARLEIINSPTANSADPYARKSANLGQQQASALTAGWPKLRLASFQTVDAEGQTAATGPVWLEHFNQHPAAGYMVQLPPGCQLDISVDGTSEGENQMAVIELNRTGLPTGRTVTFTNNSDAASVSLVPRFGRLGRWSDYNSSNDFKYYLLAGIHRLYESTTDNSWHVSDFTIALQSDEVTQIGWDDSGVRIDSKWSAGEYVPDRDYNDITASILITAPERPVDATDTARGFRTVGNRAASSVSPPTSKADDEFPFAFTIGPRETAILRCVSDAAEENWVGIFDGKSKGLLWCASNASSKSLFVGAFAIENLTDQEQDYVLVSRHRKQNAAPLAAWTSSKYRGLIQNDDYWAIGFEDAGSDDDWDDIRVDIHWITR